jgi:hypothetical protein
MSEAVLSGLLDIIRGIVTITSLTIIGKTISFGLEDIFKIDCDRCCGMGKILCTNCRGTNTLYRRPAQIVPNLETFNRRYEHTYQCFICGPTTPYENLGLLGEDQDIHESDRIKEAIRCSLRKKPIQRKTPLAGTTFCTLCHGNCHFWYFTPNIAKMIGAIEPWYQKSFQKQHIAVPNGPSLPHSIYVEWPTRPLRPISEREVGYFGDDVFDYDDFIAENTWHLMESDYGRKVDSAKSSKTQKEPDDLEDFQFTTLQETFGSEE